MFEPRLKVAGTGLGDGAGTEAVSGELRERDLGEIVEDSVAMLAGWPDVDVRAAGIAVLEQGEFLDNSTSGDMVEAGKHASVTENAYIVDRCFNRCEHVANGCFCPVHRRRL